ncbi:MAG TPA: MerR family transcriptional regulator [Lacibacter sp.]|nr:MerR family transcriptional regulator [Lacibacter sp.]HMO88961.1 MerR family transcriptional regulator [Lacibacter sp.]HMP86974.1 MerR family transcriptional regulator [Lacibacter sp.]
MDYFTISDMEQLSGIKAHTLRIWEQRYRILQPHRKESRHRFYNNEDLKRVLQIAHLNRNGYKISRIARMTDEQIRSLAGEDPLHESVYENFILQLQDACRELDEERFNKIYHTLYLHLGFEKTVLHIFYPLLERMGRAWMSDSTLPVQEHFASNLIVRKMLLATQTLPPVRTGPLTILFNPENEQHDMPLLFIRYLLLKNEKRAILMGGGTSGEAIETYLKEQPAETLHFHLITNLGFLSPEERVKNLLQQFREQQLVLSGPLAGTITISHTRLRLLTSLGALLQYCEA